MEFTPVTKNNSKFAAAEKWVQNSAGIFAAGDRRVYLSHLAQVCFMLGIELETVKASIKTAYLASDVEFTDKEILSHIDKAYTAHNFASAEFSNGNLVDRKTKKLVVIELEGAPVTDVIYANECRQAAKDIYNKGYISAESTGIPDLDVYYKWKKKELTCLTGYGNEGKSSFERFLMLNKAVKDGTKFAVFGPEDHPAEEFYHDLTEMLVGADCTPNNPNKPREEIYDKAYDFVAAHFFYIYPETGEPTPEYICSRFLQLIIKEGVEGCVVDPFNTLQLDYEGSGGRDDRLLGKVLTMFGRFGVMNNVYFKVLAHPTKPTKNKDGGYDCPDRYSLAGGAMWVNRCDNIVVYYRPNRHKDKNDPVCEFHSDKIKKQKSVGILGNVQFQYSAHKRRFIFDCGAPIYRWMESVLPTLSPNRTIKNYSETSKEERLPKSGRFEITEDDPFFN